MEKQKMIALYEGFIKRSLDLNGKKVFLSDRTLGKLKTLDENWWPYFAMEIKKVLSDRRSTSEVQDRIRKILLYINKTLCFCETREEMHHLFKSFILKDLEDFKRKNA